MTTWFPPLPGDQPNETIVPIGQTEAETPEPELPFCDYREDFHDSDHICDTDVCCECGGDHCCGSSRCPVSCPPEEETPGQDRYELTRMREVILTGATSEECYEWISRNTSFTIPEAFRAEGFHMRSLDKDED